VDQVPLGFVNQESVTLDEKGAKRVWVAGTKGADEKRMATLQLCVRMRNPVADTRGCMRHQQIKQTICFRGLGRRLSKKETDQYDPRVLVAWHPKAWYDRLMCNEWAGYDFASQISVVRPTLHMLWLWNQPT
jgi:hypothetical protein